MSVFDLNGVPTISPEEVLAMTQYQIIDVRRPDEFHGELGHAPKAKLVTLGPDLVSFLEKRAKSDKLFFICRSGMRSAQATMMALDLGFVDVANIEGGMILWNQNQLPIED